MALIFWATFELGSYPMEWIESAVEWIGNIVREYLPDGMIKDLIADGIIGGVGGVIVFLPNILILYLCISFMEDSGYMARAAFIMDKVMHRLGLHEIIHPVSDGIWLYCALNHGLPVHREPFKPTDHDTDQSLHQLFGPSADLCIAYRDILPQSCHAGFHVSVFHRHSHRRPDGQNAPPLPLRTGRHSFRHGTPTLPSPDSESNSAPHVGQGRTISA